MTSFTGNRISNMLCVDDFLNISQTNTLNVLNNNVTVEFIRLNEF